MNTSVALITGASSGIGSDIATVLAEQKYNLILVARRESRLKSLSEILINKHGIQCHFIPCDLANTHDLDSLMDNAFSWAEKNKLVLNTLVNNAGNGYWGEFHAQPIENNQLTINLNITVPTQLCHQLIQKRLDQDSSSWILNVSSLSAILPAPRFAVYSGSKGYLRNFSEVLSYELRNSKISVTCSCPGGVLTEFMDHSGQTVKRNTGMMTSRDVAEQMVHAMFKGITLHVPGTFNKLARLTRVFPSSIRSLIVAQSMNVSVE